MRKNHRIVSRLRVAAALLVLLLFLCACAAADNILTLPENTLDIKEGAFYGDTSLTEVTLPEGILTIGSKAFAYSSVKRIYLPDSLQSITDDAFEGCTATGWGKDNTVGSAFFRAKENLAFEPLSDGYSGDITIWVSDAIVALTQAQVNAFKAENPKYAGMNVTVEPVSEGDTAVMMITDVSAGADIYGFAQDQLARLVAANALAPVPATESASVKALNDDGSVRAASLDGRLYAFPMTSDNGYFLYYDKSVIRDPSTLEGILQACENAGKYFGMEIGSGWSQTAFFFGAGCELSFQTNRNGAIIGMRCTYASEAGVRALKAIIATKKSSAFVNVSQFGAATNLAALVSGTWEANNARNVFGDNFAAAKLPTADGFQLSGYGGYKLLGVKPQTDVNKQMACSALASYLTGENAQLERFNEVYWGPSNKKAQSSQAVREDEALSALAAQLAYCQPQGQIPGAYWDLATSLFRQVASGSLDSADDSQLLATLTSFENNLKAALTN